MSPLLLRPTRYDAPAAVELTALVQAWYTEIYGGTDDNPIDADEFVPPHGEFLVGFQPDAGRPGGELAVAMGGWRAWTEPFPITGTRPAELRRMFVRAEHRGRGHARTLLTELERRAAAHGHDLMVLEAGRVQTAALGLYAACGYRPVPRFGYYAASSGAVHLGKPLGSDR